MTCKKIFCENKTNRYICFDKISNIKGDSMRLFGKFKKKDKKSSNRNKEEEYIYSLNINEFMLLFANDGSKLRKLSSKYDSNRLERAITSRLEYEKYINTVQNTNDEKVLKDIAINVKESDKLVCLAIEKIDNKQYLIDIINNKKVTYSSMVDKIALDKLKESGDLVEALNKTAKTNPYIRDYILDNLSQSELIKIAKTNSNASFAGEAASRITNKSDLRGVFKNAKHDEARAMALTKLNDVGLSNKVVKEGPGKWGDKTVASAIHKSNNVAELRQYKMYPNSKPERSAAIKRLKDLGML